ncbi:hypothetical protein KC356_g251 [Hortaea werneckii]|nr:hypothetical protein KC356_g251 [Hortaea werneckii]
MYLSTQHHSCKSVIRMLKPFIVFEGTKGKAVVIAQEDALRLFGNVTITAPNVFMCLIDGHNTCRKENNAPAHLSCPWFVISLCSLVCPSFYYTNSSNIESYKYNKIYFYKYTARLHEYRFVLAAMLAFALGALISGFFSNHTTSDVTQALGASSLNPAETFDLLCAWDNPTYPSNKCTSYRPMPVSKGSLNQWGWQQDPSSTELASNTREALRGAFAALGFPLTDPDITMSTWVQDQEGSVTIKGQEIEFSETGARYQNAFSARHGFVVAEYNVSPPEQIKRNKAKGMDWEWHAPRLSKWSDVLYVVMRWQVGFGETRFGNYQWCFRAMIKNPETKAIVKQALGGRLQNVRPWPGKSFRVSQGSEVGKALLGSPNGSGAGFMFADRKTDLGKKVVSEIIIFDGVSGEGRKDEDIKPCMAMKVIDKPERSNDGIAGGGANANVGASSNSNHLGKRSFWQSLKGMLRGVEWSKL